MDIYHKQITGNETTNALPCESNHIELEWREVRFLVRIIKKVCQAIASLMPVGYEDETGFHYGLAEARLIPIRTGRRAKPDLRRGG
jgi:hypothetical protein